MIFLLFAVPIAAQEGKKDIGDASLEELGNIQVYSASKRLQSTSDAPASVTVITADDIQKYGYRTLADILESVRGFYITYDRENSFLGVRGFGRLGDWNSRILLLIDGHRINDNVNGDAFLGTEFLLDVDLIERIEIIRGPSSSLYGADAFLAVINVVTRKPPQLKGFDSRLRQPALGLTRVGPVMVANTKGIDLLLSGTFYNSQGQTCSFPSSTAPPPITGLHETRITKTRSTSWAQSASMDSPSRDYSAHAIGEFLPHTTALCSTTLAPKTSTTISTSISVISIPLLRSGT
jgi:iron complex outermembrane receptor protein